MPGIGLLFSGLGLGLAAKDSIKRGIIDETALENARKNGQNIEYYDGARRWVWNGEKVRVSSGTKGFPYVIGESFFAFTNPINREQKIAEVLAYNELHNENKDYYTLGNKNGGYHVNIYTGRLSCEVKIVTSKCMTNFLDWCRNPEPIIYAEYDPLSNDFYDDTIDSELLDKIRRYRVAAHIVGLSHDPYYPSSSGLLCIDETGYPYLNVDSCCSSLSYSEDERAYHILELRKKVDKTKEVADKLPKGSHLEGLEDEPVLTPTSTKKYFKTKTTDEPYWTHQDRQGLTWEFLVRKVTIRGVPESLNRPDKYRIYTKNKNIGKWEVLFNPLNGFNTIHEAQQYANYLCWSNAITSYWTKDIPESEVWKPERKHRI